jgi:hypothetical protein
MRDMDCKAIKVMARKYIWMELKNMASLNFIELVLEYVKQKN